MINLELMAIKQKNISLSQSTAEWLSNFFENNQDVLNRLNIESEDQLLETFSQKRWRTVKKDDERDWEEFDFLSIQ